MRALPPIFPLEIQPIPFHDPGPPILTNPQIASPSSGQNSPPPSILPVSPPVTPFPEIEDLTNRLQAVTSADEIPPILNELVFETAKLPANDVHIPVNLFTDLALSLTTILSDLGAEGLLAVVRITRGIAEFLQRLISPVFRLPPIQVPMHKQSGGSPPIRKPSPRIVSVSFRVSRSSVPHKFNGFDSPEGVVLNHFDVLFTRALYVLACHPDLSDDAGELQLQRLVSCLHHPSFAGPAKLLGAAALVQLSGKPGIRGALFQMTEFRQLFTLLRTPGDCEPTTCPFICQLVALFRRLADDSEFPRVFAIDEVGAGLVQAIRVAATYRTVVLNAVSYLLIFAQNRAVVQRVIVEFGDEVLVALALQMLSMSRASSDAIVAVCSWFGGLVEKHEQLAAVAATIVDPLDISVCTEFLSVKMDRLVVRSLLHLIAAFSVSQACAEALSKRKEISSLFAKPAVIADAELCTGLLNVVERFTFYDHSYAPEKLMKAIPVLLKSSERSVRKAALHIICQIASPDHPRLLQDGIPGLVMGFIADTDATMCYLGLRVISRLIGAFHREQDFFAEFQGKQRILELARRHNLSHAVVSALTALVDTCGEFTRDELDEIEMALRGFDGLGASKPVVEPVDSWL
jgi:hypothetical protein